MSRRNTSYNPISELFRDYRTATVAVEGVVNIYAAQLETALKSNAKAEIVKSVMTMANEMLGFVASTNRKVYDAYVAINATFPSEFIDEVFKKTRVHDHYRLLVHNKIFQQYYTYDGFALFRTVHFNSRTITFEFRLLGDQGGRRRHYADASIDDGNEDEEDYEYDRPDRVEPPIRNPRSNNRGGGRGNGRHQVDKRDHIDRADRDQHRQPQAPRGRGKARGAMSDRSKRVQRVVDSAPYADQVIEYEDDQPAEVEESDKWADQDDTKNEGEGDVGEGEIAELKLEDELPAQ